MFSVGFHFYHTSHAPKVNYISGKCPENREEIHRLLQNYLKKGQSLLLQPKRQIAEQQAVDIFCCIAFIRETLGINVWFHTETMLNKTNGPIAYAVFILPNATFHRTHKSEVRHNNGKLFQRYQSSVLQTEVEPLFSQKFSQ